MISRDYVIQPIMLKPYKGYVGQVELDEEANILFGSVIDLWDVITFQGTTVEEAIQSFHDSVDDYLAFCKGLGEKPEMPSHSLTPQPALQSQSTKPQPGQPSPNSTLQLPQRLQSLTTQSLGRVAVALVGGVILLLIVTGVLVAIGVLGLIGFSRGYVSLLILLAVLDSIGIIALIRIGYEHEGSGLPGYTKISTTTDLTSSPPKKISITEEKQPAKTLWDWLTLLIIPIVLAAGALGLGAFQNQENLKLSTDQFHLAATQYVSEQHIAATQYANAQQLALESTFQTYLDHMTDLLTNPHLHEDTQLGKDTRSLATARTLTILPDLSKLRIATVLKFLYDGGLIKRQTKEDKDRHFMQPVVNLNGADLSGIDLNGFVLSGADLAFVNFKGSKLMNAHLSSAFLPGADLSGAYLNGADLSFAQLFNQQANQPPEIANLTGAHLNEANLTGADLIQANLTNAVLSGADLSKSSLNGAIVTNTVFTNVTWKNTTCPDGTNSDANDPSSCNVG